MNVFIDRPGLQEKLNEFTLEIEDNKLFLLKTYGEINQLLNRIDVKNHISFFYLNKSFIHKIIDQEEQILKIEEKNIIDNIHKSMFLLSLAIKSEKYFVNYSYNDELINKLYQRIKEEKKEIKKLILYILFQIILDNYKNLNNPDDSFTSEDLENFSKEVKDSINEYFPSLNIFKITFEPKNEIDIEDVYIKIISSLIKDKKLEDYEYSKNIIEQLDLENIELTHNIYSELKKVLDNDNEKDFLNIYRFKNFEELIKEKTINFYFILLKYIFKDNIYIYNIQFLFKAKKSILKILKDDYSKVIEILNYNCEEEKSGFNARKKFILNKFLDSEYYKIQNIFIKLKEVLNYYIKFKSSSKSKEIEDIKKIITNGELKRGIEYLSDYDIAKKFNKRYNILKYIKENINEKCTEVSIGKNDINVWENIEKCIHEKKYKKINQKYRNIIFNYFSEEKNKEDILKIFEQEEVVSFIQNYNLLTFVKVYYQNFFFELKKEDIEIIDNINQKNKKNDKIEEYLKDLETAKQMNEIYKLISKVFQINKDSITEAEVHAKLEEWNKIKKMFEEKKFEIVNDETKIELFIFFNNQNNVKLIKEESYKFLLEQRKEVEKVILDYYKTFNKETKKSIINEIEKGIISDENLRDYFIAKKMLIKKPLIFCLLDDENNYDETNIAKVCGKFEKIEKNINNEKFNDIDKEDRKKLIKFFKSNKSVQIFDKEKIKKFLDFKEEEYISTKTKEFEQAKYNKKVKHREKYKYNVLSQSGNISQNTTQISTQGSSREKNPKIQEINNKDDLIKLNIFIKQTGILWHLKNKEITFDTIYIKNSENKLPIFIDENDFNKCKKYYSNQKDTHQYKIFDFIEHVKKEIISESTNDSKLVLELTIEKKDLDYYCKYKLFLPSDFLEEKVLTTFIDYKITSDKSKGEGLKYLLRDISELKKHPTKIVDNQTNDIQKSNITENPSKQNSNVIEATVIENQKSNKNWYYIDKKETKHKILSFIGVIGNHNERGKLYTAEFIKELKDCKYYISSGTDKRLKFYDSDFNEIKNLEITEIKDWVYSIFQRDKNSFLACANKELYLFYFNKEDNNTHFSTYELPNMTCISSLEMNVRIKKEKDKDTIKKKAMNNNKKSRGKQKEEIKEPDEIKEPKEKNVKLTMIVGRNGLIGLEDMIDDSNYQLTNQSEMNHFNKFTDKTYRNIIKLNEQNVALVSNSIIPGGENKLIIFNVYTRETKETIEGYSFTASTNGMSVMHEQQILLCACKKYTEYQKNGILLVFLNYEENTNSKAQLFSTGDFEVYCFCPIAYPDYGKKHRINENYDKESDFFLVGGFHKKRREGKIKLFKLVKDESNIIKGIKYLQDIEIDKSKGEKNEKENFHGFKGAISSIIQSSETKNILVSCYDGKIYLLSKLNLEGYGEKLN